MPIPFFRRLALPLVLMAAAIAPPPVEPAASPARVLVVFGCQPRQPACLEAAQAIETTFTEAAGNPSELYFEFLDTSRLGRPADAGPLVRYLTDKYARRQPTLLVTSGSDATDVVLQRHDELWPDAPIVAFGLDHPRRDAPPDLVQLTARPAAYAPGETIEAALRMVPGARTVYFVGGAGPGDQSAAELFHTLVRARLPSVPIVEIRGLTLEDTLERVSHLPPDGIVWTFGIFVDGAGRRYIPAATVGPIATASNRPVFVLSTGTLGTGAVGGFLTDFGAEARSAARVALEVLAGKPSPRLPVDPAVPVPMFDWRQLRRWGIDQARLPKGSVIRFREPSFLERYWAWLALALFQTALIVGLLVQRRQRQRAAGAAAASESLNRSVIASLSGLIAVIDRDGTLIQANEAWRDHQAGGPGEPLAGARPGENLRRIWAETGEAGTSAPRLWDPIEHVLARESPESHVEYAHESGGEVRWFRWTARALDRDEGGAIVSLTDVTARKLAELEGRRALQEIAHMSRVTTVGGLAVSLAHEINQPLAAILTNAQASTKLLSREVPDVEDVKEALGDIASDARRAGEVIRRMRSMLQKGETVRVPVDLNEIVRDVLALVGPEAQLRRVALQPSLGEPMPAVSADGVQLQQVVLNLLVNALDAVDGGGATRKRIRVSTIAEDDLVQLLVEDDGPGIQPDTLPRIFDPFFTTKPSGLGMGLAIIKSIVEVHGGRITAENKPEGGAVFRCLFPREPELVLPARQRPS